MTNVIAPATTVASASIIASAMMELINNAVIAEGANYGARKAFAAGINNEAPADCKWYALEANGQKLPVNIQAIKSAYYAGLKGINYSNPSNAWRMVKEYAKENACERSMFGEIPPVVVTAENVATAIGGDKKEHRTVQARMLADLTAVHDYCIREIGKNNPEFTDKHVVAHRKVIEALKAIGKTIGL